MLLPFPLQTTRLTYLNRRRYGAGGLFRCCCMRMKRYFHCLACFVIWYNFSCLFFVYYTRSNFRYFDQFKIGDNAIKYAMSVAGWPFRTIQNKLRIRMTSYAVLDSGNGCSSTSVGNDGSDNLRWLTIRVNGFSLYPSHSHIHCPRLVFVLCAVNMAGMIKINVIYLMNLKDMDNSQNMHG